MNSYIALDLEMTGLNPKYEKIIEIGAVKITDGKTGSVYQTFVNPERRLDEHVTEITGITDDELKAAPSISEVIGDFTEFCGDLPLLGHRILTDFSFIKHSAVNNGLVFEKYGVDTLKLSRICRPELPSKRLSDMCSFYGIEYRAHRALNDAEATVKLFNALTADFYDKTPEIFEPEKLVYQVKKESPIRKDQLEKLKIYIERHHIDCPYELKAMTRNEATRYYDRLVAKYGK